MSVYWKNINVTFTLGIQIFNNGLEKKVRFEKISFAAFEIGTVDFLPFRL